MQTKSRIVFERECADYLPHRETDRWHRMAKITQDFVKEIFKKIDPRRWQQALGKDLNLESNSSHPCVDLAKSVPLFGFRQLTQSMEALLKDFRHFAKQLQVMKSDELEQVATDVVALVNDLNVRGFTPSMPFFIN